MPKVRTYLMFQGTAEQAVSFYSSVFPSFIVGPVARYREGEPGAPGAFKLAPVSFADHELLILDSPPIHDFSFTPSVSLFLDFETQDTLDTAFGKLSEGGNVMMPLDNYGFSARFGWVADRFGVSWQLNLPN